MSKAVKDITNELSTLARGLLRTNCSTGYYCGGELDGRTYLRRWDSQTMRQKGSDILYVRTGEIFENERGEPMIVYRPGEAYEKDAETFYRIIKTNNEYPS